MTIDLDDPAFNAVTCPDCGVALREAVDAFLCPECGWALRYLDAEAPPEFNGPTIRGG